MNKFFLLAVLFLSFPSISQKHGVGLKGGINFTNMTTSDIDGNRRTGFSAGVTYQNDLSKHFHFGIDATYEQRGYKFIFDLRDQNNDFLGTYAVDYKYDYLTFPIKFGIHTGNQVKPFASIGVVPGILLKAITIVSPVETLPGEKANVTELVNRIDIAGLAELGIRYSPTDKLEILSSVTLSRSFTTITNKEYFWGRTIKHYGAIIAIGARYYLD